MEYIAFDCHKRYTYAVVENERGIQWEGRIPHEDRPLRGSSLTLPLALLKPRKP